MKIRTSILPVCVLSLATSAAQGVPLIQVTKERLCMNAEVTLEYPDGSQKLFQDRYIGSLFSGDQFVDAYQDTHYLPRPFDDPGYYDDVWISMVAEFLIYSQGGGSDEYAYKRFLMFNEADVYPAGEKYNPNPDRILNSVVSFESTTKIAMEFYVLGDGASTSFRVFNEGTYAPWGFSLFDLTTSEPLFDFATSCSGPPWCNDRRIFFPLLDGHSYRLDFMVSDQGEDDDDVYSSVEFTGLMARASVAEPAMSYVFLSALAGLLAVGGRRRLDGGSKNGWLTR